ncbi:MAG: hypothetical protein OXL96_16295 [Candidatus Poribacteria bacterium]|nr:hypothetical protein [Candidatus Poribacteria bacterium]
MANGQPNGLSFSQRYGYEPLPESMRLEYLSEDLRREIWNTVRDLLLGIRKYDSFALDYYFHEKDEEFLVRTLGTLTKTAEDEIPTRYDGVAQAFKSIIMTDHFNVVLDLVEMLLNSSLTSPDFLPRITALLEKYNAAYRLDKAQHSYRFFPQGSKEQGEATQRAIEILHESDMSGATTHLRQAAEHINARQYADSISDSIHAVESAARGIAPKAKTLGGALKHLESEGLLTNRTLKNALEKLYGYTNDEQGIRHALLDQDISNVDVDEAVFMYGACASFAAYLTSKCQQTAQQETDGQ